MVTVNSDDPAMFGNSLSQDFMALMTELSFTPAEVRTLILNGIWSSWLDPDQKRALETTFTRSATWLETPVDHR
jgi:adenosine deaminase